MKTLLKEEKTPTTSKKTFVDENGIELNQYVFDCDNVGINKIHIIIEKIIRAEINLLIKITSNLKILAPNFYREKYTI